MSGLFDAAQLPLALMVSADQVPFCFADIGRPRHWAGLLDPRSDPDCHHVSSSLQACVSFSSNAGYAATGCL